MLVSSIIHVNLKKLHKKHTHSKLKIQKSKIKSDENMQCIYIKCPSNTEHYRQFSRDQ